MNFRIVGSTLMVKLYHVCLGRRKRWRAMEEVKSGIGKELRKKALKNSDRLLRRSPSSFYLHW